MSDSNPAQASVAAEDSFTRDLLDRAKTGSESAVNTLMDRHRKQIRNLVQMRMDRTIRQRVDVSDVVQEIFLDAFRRLSSYLDNPKLPFHIWLKQIARDRMIDSWRTHRQTSKRSMDRETRAGVGIGGADLDKRENSLSLCQLTPAAIAMQKELSLHVESAIDQLQETDSRVIIMRHYHAMTNRQIAAELELSEAAASIRYVRALEKLKKLLADPNGSTDDARSS